MKYVIVLSSLDGLIISIMVNASKVVSNLQKPFRLMLQFKTTILTNKYFQIFLVCVSWSYTFVHLVEYFAHQ
jgi:hypothetical protein